MSLSMVLRFRDLIGKTIDEHDKTIKRNGYAWWGWWNKPIEAVPTGVFNHFKTEMLHNGYLTIFLADSGNSLLYRAKLLEIHYGESGEDVPSEEPQKTPSYYRTKQYRAWYKIKDIEEINEIELRNWAYVEVPGFYDDQKDERFAKKRVYGLKEMLSYRHRTIYFIEGYDAGSHRDVALESETKASGACFMTKPIITRSNFIMHLSDLHFGSLHRYKLHSEANSKSLLDIISEDLRKYNNNKPPAAILISGDLTSTGIEEEYNQAYEFITGLKSVNDLDINQIIIIPGNHDITWFGKKPKGKKPVKMPPSRAENNYRSFFHKLYGFPANEYLSMGRRIILQNYCAIDIIGLNSSRLEQVSFSGYGFVGSQQIQQAFEEMGWNEDRGVKYRFVMMHHHLIPVSPVEEIEKCNHNYSLSLDSGHISCECLAKSVDLFLHGHQHQPFYSGLSRGEDEDEYPSTRILSIHGTGSIGAKREKLGPIGKNCYSVLEINIDQLKIENRSESETRAQFTHNSRFIYGKNQSGGLDCIRISK